MIKKTILLFDVDGTLTPARQVISDDMMQFLRQTRKTVPVAVVGGSDLVKIVEQLGESLEDVLASFDYVFSENGLVSYRSGEALPVQTIQDHIGEDKLQKFINFSLAYLAKVQLPIKRGTFVEFRKGMLNLSPIGRSCTQQERMAFVEFDTKHKIREKFVQALRENFPADEYDLQISIGGQISVDVFPRGWDKTFCLQYLDRFDTIHFFGDKTSPGGNDYEIFTDNRTIGHSVSGPSDTIEKVKSLDFMK